MLKSNFKVGKTEIHEIEFYFNQFGGNEYIKVEVKTLSPKHAEKLIIPLRISKYG